MTVAIALASSVGAAGVLTIGATNALFGATETSATNTFAAGTVSVDRNSKQRYMCCHWNGPRRFFCWIRLWF